MEYTGWTLASYGHKTKHAKKAKESPKDTLPTANSPKSPRKSGSPKVKSPKKSGSPKSKSPKKSGSPKVNKSPSPKKKGRKGTR